ncbi:transposase [Nocardia sp. NPDC052254]|uniref:transposase n=1 Tax=Nocardia sp. NPDC052254 TaxID=3155681 RepID=UPI003421E26F
MSVTHTKLTASGRLPVRLRIIDGIGPVLAARLVGRTGLATRFSTAAAYATYNGTAPVEISSADHRVHRMSRSSDHNAPTHGAAD